MVRLVSWSGAQLFVSTAHVLALEPDINPGRTVIRFCLVDNHDCSGLGGLVSETVQGTPEQISALLGGGAMVGGLIARAAMHARAERRAVAIDGDRSAL